jgi:hypothetical protein
VYRERMQSLTSYCNANNLPHVSGAGVRAGEGGGVMVEAT